MNNQKTNFNSKKIKIFLSILTLLILINGLSINYAEDLGSYEYLKLNITNQIEFKLIFEKNYNIETFNVDSYILPISYDGTQALNEFKTSSLNYEIKNDSNNYFIRYNFDEDSLKKENIITNTFIVESTTFNPKIKTKSNFPVRNVNLENQNYLKFAGLIDIDDNIREKANELATGEDDTFVIAAKIAKWITEDVNYDLSTVTEKPNQKSSDVFKSKAGVCKEISNLYTSMLRSLGIPTRIVTGYAYTEGEEIVKYLNSNWGGHAWTEVLIEDNWVPFDLTYNEYGYVDSSHIIFDKNFQIRNTSIEINSYGYGYQFNGNSNIKTEFEVLDKQNIKSNQKYDLTIEGPKELGFESYGYLKLKIKNLENNYNVLFVKLAKTPEIELIDSEKEMIILIPNEEKELYFRYKIGGDLNPNYQYTFPFKIYNNELKKEFNVTVREDYLNIKETSLPKDEEKNNLNSNNKLEFNCNYDLGSPNNKIFCLIKNPNNYEIENINICLNSNENSCEKINLRINEEKEINFETSNYNEIITYTYNSNKDSIELNLQKPSLKIDYKTENQKLIFNYTIQNYTNGVKLNIYKNNSLYKSYNQNERNNVSILLDYGQNNISLNLEIGNKIIESKKFELNVKKPKLTFIEKIIEWFKNLF